MTCERSLFVNYRELKSPISLTVGDGHVVSGIGTGTVRLSLVLGRSSTKTIYMKEVLYVPALSTNLVSVSVATNNGVMVLFGHTRCWLKSTDGQVYGTCTRKADALYYLNMAKQNTRDMPP